MRTSLILATLFMVSFAANAQPRLPLQPMSLESLAAFDKPGENWKLAGTVQADRHIRHDLVISPGTGILVNQPSEGARTNLYTNWSHGDIELELEFMMPRGSNSGIYLQGRYEVQLLDSWKRPQVTFGDVGGIYQRWDESRQQGFEGRPPRLNASRAPGLWQKLHILFEAPEYDANGRKTRNARFAQVTLNGSVIQENVTVSGPTRAAGFDDEAPTGPLMIQGDHGPVAFRNFSYRTFGSDAVTVANVTYHEYHDEPLEEVTWNGSGTPTLTGTANTLQEHTVTSTSPVAVRYEGELRIPRSGTYRFGAALGWITGDPHWSGRPIGGALLQISGQNILKHAHNQTTVYADTQLDQGVHPFVFSYHKAVGWGPPSVTLSIEGPTIPVQTLLHPIQRPAPVARIPVATGNAPLILRGFVVHQGAKRTHAVSVGNPGNLHYSLDLADGALLYAWRGPFLDAASMWHNRGHDQTVTPLGSTLIFSGASGYSISTNEVPQFMGYRLNPHPIFTYSIGEADLEDHIHPHSDGTGLSRTITLSGTTEASVWVRAAVSDQIDALGDDRYAIDGFTWYIEEAADAVIQPTENSQTLMIPLNQDADQATAKYLIVW